MLRWGDLVQVPTSLYIWPYLAQYTVYHAWVGRPGVGTYFFVYLAISSPIYYIPCLGWETQLVQVFTSLYIWPYLVQYTVHHDWVGRTGSGTYFFVYLAISSPIYCTPCLGGRPGLGTYFFVYLAISSPIHCTPCLGGKN